MRASAWSRLDDQVERVLAKAGAAHALDRDLAEMLRVVAASVRAGASLPQALARASARGEGHVARACARCAARIELGRPIEEEVDTFAATLGTPASALFARVVRVQHRHGGDLATPCHRLAALLHERCRLDGEARSATAQARFSANAVLAIPVLLLLAAVWRAPEATRAALHFGPLLLASPGIALIIAGSLVARRTARAAVDIGRSATQTTARGGSWTRALIARAAGDGPQSLRAVRLGLGAGLLSTPAMLAHPARATFVLTSIAVLAGLAWPWTDQRRIMRARAQVAGVEELLEVSIALFSAGASAHDVATLAPDSVPEPLRSELADAAHKVGLGRTIASAFGASDAVVGSPQLEGWLHAICVSAELGAPAIDVLEQLLRDARAERRERLRSVAQTAGPRMQLALVFLVVPGIMWVMLLASVGGLLGQLRSAGVA